MQKRILGASLAAAVLFVVACTGTASASLIKALRLQVAGTALAVGAPIVASSSNTTVSNAFWSLACSESSLTGTIGQNNKAKNDFMPDHRRPVRAAAATKACARSTFEFVTAWLPKSPAELILERKGNAQLRFFRIRLTPLEDINNAARTARSLRGGLERRQGHVPADRDAPAAHDHLHERENAPRGRPRQRVRRQEGPFPDMSGTFTFTSDGAGGGRRDLRTRIGRRFDRAPLRLPRAAQPDRPP